MVKLSADGRSKEDEGGEMVKESEQYGVHRSVRLLLGRCGVWSVVSGQRSVVSGQ
jgi:hypothetical protein